MGIALYVLNSQNYISNPFIQLIFFETSERHYTFKHIRLPNFIMWIRGSREIPILHSSIFKRIMLVMIFVLVFFSILYFQVSYQSFLLHLGLWNKSKRTCLLVKLYLPLPNSNELKSKTILEYLEFSSDKLVIPAYGEVGSSKFIKNMSSLLFPSWVLYPKWPWVIHTNKESYS